MAAMPPYDPALRLIVDTVILANGERLSRLRRDKLQFEYFHSEVYMNKYIAYCGLNCEMCEARLATVNNDDSLREKVAAEWSALNGVTITPEMINCVGCRIDGVKTPYCASLCPIRQCALGRQVETCGGCVEMNACEKLGSILKNNKECMINLSDCIIRSEQPEDYAAVENLIREAFWNVYRPGCSEHYVMHVLRGDPAFIRELDFVMEQGGHLIGQNMFMKTVIDADDGRVIPVLTMGPICITPELKRKGFGKKLLDHSLEKAAEMGFGAVLFEGNIGFYGKSGFDYARNFGIRYHDLPAGADDSFFLCKELIPGYLSGVTGVYQTPAGYYVEDAAVEEFDRSFPPKTKLKLPGQLF